MSQDDEGNAGGAAGAAGVPSVPKELDGNARIIRAMFTWFPVREINPEAKDVIFEWQEQLRKHCTYFTMQSERGTRQNRFHYQGYFELRCRMRIGQIKKELFGDKKCPIHFMRRRGTQDEAIDYCNKEESRVDGLKFTIGVACPIQKTMDADNPKSYSSEIIEVRNRAIASLKRGRNPMNDIWNSENAEMALRFPGGVSKLVTATTIDYQDSHRTYRSGVDVILLYGASGTGKSYQVNLLEERLVAAGQDVLRIQAGDINQGRICADARMDGKTVRCIFIEECMGLIDRAFFLTLCDPYTTVRLNVKYSAAGIRAEPVLIVITMNDPPHLWFRNHTGELAHAVERRITQRYEFKSMVDSFTHVWKFSAECHQQMREMNVNLEGINYEVVGASTFMLEDDEATIATPI